MRRINPLNPFFLFTALVFFILSGIVQAEEKPLIGARHPAISPDGKQIAFSYMGDIWLVPTEGGKAYRLTDNLAYEREPIWSPDGQWLAFTSNRFGNNDVFIMKSQGGTPIQLTFHSGDDVATDFTPDSRWVIFRSGRASSSSLYKVPVTGGNELPVLETYWNWAYQARISPDGRSVLFSEGMENGFWWRRGYRGANTAKLWIKELDGTVAKKIVDDSSNAFWPDWSLDGSRLYFVSDRKSGVYNIWTAARDGSDVKPVTQFKQGDVRWMSVAARAPMAAYEKDFGVWIRAAFRSTLRPRTKRTGRSSSKTRPFRNSRSPRTGRRSRRSSAAISSSCRATAVMPGTSPTAPGASETSIGIRTAGILSLSPTSMPARIFTSSRRSATTSPGA
jgi:tricorn protease